MMQAFTLAVGFAIVIWYTGTAAATFCLGAGSVLLASGERRMNVGYWIISFLCFVVAWAVCSALWPITWIWAIRRNS